MVLDGKYEIPREILLTGIMYLQCIAIFMENRVRRLFTLPSLSSLASLLLFPLIPALLLTPLLLPFHFFFSFSLSALKNPFFSFPFPEVFLT